MAFTQFHLGYATAMSIVLLVIVVTVSAGQFLLLRDDTWSEGPMGAVAVRAESQPALDGHQDEGAEPA